MTTTLLNPTIWLLAAAAIAGILGATRRWTARESFEALVVRAASWPVLVLLGALALAGTGSRVAIGYLAPGAYAEEVVSAREFLSARQLYRGDDHEELRRWLTEEPVRTAPWDLPGISSCRAGAMRQRPLFYTSQSHSPALLSASAPVVYVLGGRGLYVAITLLSLAGLAAMAAVLAAAAGIPWRSKPGLLLTTALVGWQPVLAGIRQGDAVLVAASLALWGWHVSSRRPLPAGLSMGLAAVTAPPASAFVVAFARHRPAVLVTALSAMAAILGLTTVAAGPMVVPDFLDGLGTTARAYAGIPGNYALIGRLVGKGDLPLPLALWVASAALLAATWRAPSADRACAQCAVAGVLLAPAAWSQHLTLALPGVVVLFDDALSRRHSLALTGWAAAVLLLSCPDQVIGRVTEALFGSAHLGIPLAPFAVVLVWILLVTGRERPATSADTIGGDGVLSASSLALLCSRTARRASTDGRPLTGAHVRQPGATPE